MPKKKSKEKEPEKPRRKKRKKLKPSLIDKKAEKFIRENYKTDDFRKMTGSIWCPGRQQYVAKGVCLNKVINIQKKLCRECLGAIGIMCELKEAKQNGA